MFLFLQYGSRRVRLASPSASPLPRCFVLTQQARRRFTIHTPPVPAFTRKPLRILFCGSDAFSCKSLEALVRLRDQSEIIQHIRVVCRPPKRAGSGMKKLRSLPVHDLARDLNLSYSLVDCEDDWEKDRFIKKDNINLIVAVSFGLMVPGWLIKSAEYGGLNVHPSLLPDLRGAAPVHWTLLLQRPHTGVTLQTLSIGAFDRGKILDQTPFPGITVFPDDTVEKLTHLLASRGAEMLTICLRKGLHLQANNPNFSPRFARFFRSDVCAVRAPKITSADRQVRWTEWTADQVALRNRVLGPLWSYVLLPGHGRKRVRLDGISAPGILSWPPEVVPFLQSVTRPPAPAPKTDVSDDSVKTDDEKSATTTTDGQPGGPTNAFEKDDGPAAWPEEILHAEGKRRGLVMNRQTLSRGFSAASLTGARSKKIIEESLKRERKVLGVGEEEFDWYSLKTATFFELQDEELPIMAAFDKTRLQAESKHRREERIAHLQKSRGVKPKVNPATSIKEAMHLGTGIGRPVELPFFIRHYGTTDTAVIPIPTIRQSNDDSAKPTTAGEISAKDGERSGPVGGVIAIQHVVFDSEEASENAAVAFHRLGGLIPEALDKVKNEADVNDELPRERFAERFASKFAAMHWLYRGWRVDSSPPAAAAAATPAQDGGENTDSLSPSPPRKTRLAIPAPKLGEEDDFDRLYAQWQDHVQQAGERFLEKMEREKMDKERKSGARMRNFRDKKFTRVTRVMTGKYPPLQPHLKESTRPAEVSAHEQVPPRAAPRRTRAKQEPAYMGLLRMTAEAAVKNREGNE